MRVLVLGGSGFIGPRVMRRLLDHGHEVHCIDIAPDSPSLEAIRDRVTITHGDITLMDDVMEMMALSQPDRVLNLAYALGASEADPHPQVRLNIMGMDNCFEAARILGIR
ncbi:MAG: NAD-dependent epimerase/dehydratase family protein, partial [Dehalococcoidia bacterium]|nr:NAD-dependent epimerase/dehydratase family protein [Dehalococcoidia bacterium]